MAHSFNFSLPKQLALNAIFQIGGVNKAIAQRVFAANNGQRPRNLKTATGEDALSGGHTVGRHVVGNGIIQVPQNLIDRVNGLFPQALCGNTAGAYASMGDSQIGMQNAMTACVGRVTWHVIRQNLIRGLAYDITEPAAVNGYVAHRDHTGLHLYNNPTHVYLPLQGADVEGGFSVFHSWPQF